jgi:GNAT superfamily N-acetyltransferase
MRRLNEAEISRIYETHMREAFPPDELKPLVNILRMLREGDYEVWAEEDADDIRAYACVFTGADPVLIDYFAVRAGLRGQGIGSGFLKKLVAQYPAVMLEVERPELAQNDRDRSIRSRRIAFYERLGFVMTPLRATVFTVPYAVMVNSEADIEDLRRAYARVYRHFVPTEEGFARHVHIDPALS